MPSLRPKGAVCGGRRGWLGLGVKEGHRWEVAGTQKTRLQGGCHPSCWSPRDDWPMSLQGEAGFMSPLGRLFLRLAALSALPLLGPKDHSEPSLPTVSPGAAGLAISVSRLLDVSCTLESYDQ